MKSTHWTQTNRTVLTLKPPRQKLMRLHCLTPTVQTNVVVTLNPVIRTHLPLTQSLPPLTLYLKLTLIQLPRRKAEVTVKPAFQNMTAIARSDLSRFVNRPQLVLAGQCLAPHLMCQKAVARSRPRWFATRLVPPEL
uniref:Uncharacterized protein n=1 Tax=Cacopsylla melanoneura TaxID=428564 RepID=A0A8D8QBJ2_9HEMI